MQPHPDYDSRYQVIAKVGTAGKLMLRTVRIGSHNLRLIKQNAQSVLPDRLLGANIVDRAELTSDTVRFSSWPLQALELNRYYRNDFDGFIVDSSGPTAWTHGLNCQSSKYNDQDFIDFHNSWGK
jgi:hypothetical protein